MIVISLHFLSSDGELCAVLLAVLLAIVELRVGEPALMVAQGRVVASCLCYF